jgi:hypothetical protein
VRIGGLDWAGQTATVVKTSVAALAMGITLALILNQWSDAPVFVIGIGGLLAGALVFVVVAAALRTAELNTLRRLLPGRR